jgi:hypothetical protein
LLRVEQLFRQAKAVLATRPIYHSSDMAIRGHVFCSFLALLLAPRTDPDGRDSRMRLLPRVLDGKSHFGPGVKGSGLWEPLVRQFLDP